MKESNLLAAVIELAHRLGWRVAHFHTSLTRSGHWVTAVQGDGKGFPDCVLVRRDRLVFAELKVGYNKTSPEQNVWIEALEGTGAEVYVWRDKDWESGVIERCLSL